jgi:hypothetical protein
LSVPFRARWTPEALAQFEKLRSEAAAPAEKRSKGSKAKPSRAEGLLKQVEKCVGLLLNNPRHPGLQTHEYDSIENPYNTGAKVFEAYAQNNTPGAYRIFWCYGPGQGELTIIAITPHP